MKEIPKKFYNKAIQLIDKVYHLKKGEQQRFEKALNKMGYKIKDEN